MSFEPICPLLNGQLGGENYFRVRSQKELDVLGDQPNRATQSVNRKQIKMFLTDIAITLLKAATEDKNGTIQKLALWSGGISIKTHGRDFTEGADARTLATWEDALQQLLNGGYVTFGRSRNHFKVTSKGYDFIEALDKELI